MFEKFFKLGALGIIALVTVLLTPMLIENQDASDLMVIQGFLDGELHVFTEPGPHWQGLGKVTKYPRQAQYSFCSTVQKSGDTRIETLCDNANAPSKKLRFNDGGHANLNGFVMWEMPTDAKSIIEIHKKFSSAVGVQNAAVAKMIDGAVYLAGPLMSSTESSGARRGELVNYINDQAENGIYVTHAETVTVKDAITGQDKTDSVTKIAIGSNGLPQRQQGSVLSELNIKLQPLSISELKYDDVVENQIGERQKAITQVQNARANALRAEQDAITVAKQGEADAAKAKWEQEVIKAKEVTRAQQQLEVAVLATKEAEQFKQAEILKGQGEAERKRLVMSADGALDPKLKAYVEVNAKYADAIANYKGNWVPGVVMGNNGGTKGSGAQDMIDLLSVKTAKELGLDMSLAGASNTKR